MAISALQQQNEGIATKTVVLTSTAQLLAEKNVLTPALHNSFRDYLDLKSGLSKSKTVTGLTRLSCLDMFSLKENWLCIYSYTYPETLIPPF